MQVIQCTCWHVSLQEEITDTFQFVTFYIYFGLVLVLLIVNLWSDLGALQEPPSWTSGDEKQPLLGESPETHQYKKGVSRICFRIHSF